MTHEELNELVARLIEPEAHAEFDEIYKRFPNSVTYRGMALIGKLNSSRDRARTVLSEVYKALEEPSEEMVKAGLKAEHDDYQQYVEATKSDPYIEGKTDPEWIHMVVKAALRASPLATKETK